MTWIKAFFLALVPTPFVTAISTLCAGVLCALNIAIVAFLGSAFKNGFAHGIGVFILMIFPSPLAFMLTAQFSFYPNLIGIFLILFSSLLKKQWPMHLSKRDLYLWGGGYGIVICMVAFLLMIKKWTVNEAISNLLLSVLFFPAAILSGIITFKLIVALLRYKFAPGPAAKPSVSDQA